MLQPISNDFKVDVVLCLEATEATRPFSSAVKEVAKAFPERLLDASEMRGKPITGLRMRVIAFRRIGTDSDPIRESRFFVLPEEAEAYCDFIDSITFSGQSLPSGLEAIARALASDFVTEGRILRHCVWMISPSAAAALGTGAESPDYPAAMPADLDALCARWEMGDEAAPAYCPRRGRLLLYTADRAFWAPLECWNRYWAIYAKDSEELGTVLADGEAWDAVFDLLVGGY